MKKDEVKDALGLLERKVTVLQETYEKSQDVITAHREAREEADKARRKAEAYCRECEERVRKADRWRVWCAVSWGVTVVAWVLVGLCYG